MVDEYRVLITVLCFNRIAKDIAPTIPILFWLRCNVVSVWIGWTYVYDIYMHIQF